MDADTNTDIKLRNMTSIYISCGTKILLLYRIGSRVVPPSWCGIGGHFEPDELNDPRTCVLRELEEEVGASCGRLTYLGCLYSSPGFSSEVLHMYLAQELTEGACHPDEDEFLSVERIPFSALVEQVRQGEIKDAKTVALVLKAKLLGL